MKTDILQSGHCPQCGSFNINYETCVNDGEELYYPFICDDCGFKGKEHYNLTFYGMTTADDDEITIDHDKK